MLGSLCRGRLQSSPQGQHVLQHHCRVLCVVTVIEKSPLPTESLCALPQLLGCRDRRSSYVLMASSPSKARGGELLLL